MAANMPMWVWIVVGLIVMLLAGWSIWWANIKAQELFDALDKWEPPRGM